MNHKITTQLLFIITLAACTCIPNAIPAIINPTKETTITIYTTITPGVHSTIVTFPQEIVQKGARMKLVPTGDFKMGNENDREDEKPAHLVSLDAYYIDVFEVTNGLYQMCVMTGACTNPGDPGSFSRESYYGEPDYVDYPVIYVNWEQAQDYCTWRGARMPTEAEWERAARGGLEGMDYPWGNEAPLCQLGLKNGANFDDGWDCVDADTQPVGSYAPNGYGLYDMAGNIWEWTADWYGGYSSATGSNPSGPLGGEFRALRGGAWYGDPDNLRVSARFRLNPDDQLNNVGFRCVVSAYEIATMP